MAGLEEKRQIAAALRQLEKLKLAECFDSSRLESRPTATQVEILKDINHIQFRYVVAGSQSGKSSIGAREISWMLNGQHPYWKRPAEWTNEALLFIVAGANLSVMETEIWGRKLKPLLEPFGDWKERRSGGILKVAENLKTGDKIVFISHADSSENAIKLMKGYVAHLVWLDEMPSHHSVLNELQLRVQSKGGYFLATFTPGARNDRIRTIVDGAEPPLAKKYRLKKHNNPVYASKEAIAADLERLKGYTDSERNNILNGEWAQGESAVYSFTQAMIADALPDHYSLKWRHVESVDPAQKSRFGYTIWAEEPRTGTWYLIEDRYIENVLAPSDLIEEVKRRGRSYHFTKRISDTMPWFVEEARKAGMKYVCPLKNNNRKADLIKGLQNALSTGKVLILRDCTATIEELTSCRWAENSEHMVNPRSYHNLDCAQYFVDLMPKFEAVMAAQNYEEWIGAEHRRKRTVATTRVRPALAHNRFGAGGRQLPRQVARAL